MSLEQSGEIQLDEGCEWRFEVPFKTILTLKVVDGIGEIFGTELPNDTEVHLTGAKAAVYAPLPAGCRFQYSCSLNKENVNISSEDAKVSEYVSDESAVPAYTRLHFALDVKRQQAQASAARGPVVMVVGGAQCGKTALVKILASYAAKMDRCPLLVNLDPQQGVFSVPGSLTAAVVSDALDLEAVGGWGELPTLGAAFRQPKQPLVKSYGFCAPQDNSELFEHQAGALAAAAHERMASDANVRASGMIIDTPPWTMKDADLVQKIVERFEVDVVIAVGGDRLAVDLRRTFQSRVDENRLDIVKVPRAGGVAEVDGAFLRKTQEDLIKEYFNGSRRTHLSPFKTDVDVKSVVIYKAVRLLEYTSQMAFLPSGDSYTQEDTKPDLALDKYYVRIEATSANLENCVLAITQLDASEEPLKLLETSVLGYVHVSTVDDTKQRMSMLLPFPGQIPRKVLIATDIRYTE